MCSYAPMACRFELVALHALRGGRTPPSHRTPGYRTSSQTRRRPELSRRHGVGLTDGTALDRVLPDVPVLTEVHHHAADAFAQRPELVLVGIAVVHDGPRNTRDGKGEGRTSPCAYAPHVYEETTVPCSFSFSSSMPFACGPTRRYDRGRSSPSAIGRRRRSRSRDPAAGAHMGTCFVLGQLVLREVESPPAVRRVRPREHLRRVEVAV